MHRLLRATALVILVIAAAVLIARRYREHSTDVRTNAERILAERFARGEIDRDEFQERRDTLVGAGPAIKARPPRMDERRGRIGS